MMVRGMDGWDGMDGMGWMVSGGGTRARLALRLPPSLSPSPSHTHAHAHTLHIHSLERVQEVVDGRRVRLVPPVRAGAAARERGDRRVRTTHGRDGAHQQLGRVGGQGGGQVDLA